MGLMVMEYTFEENIRLSNDVLRKLESDEEACKNIIKIVENGNFIYEFSSLEPAIDGEENDIKKIPKQVIINLVKIGLSEAETLLGGRKINTKAELVKIFRILDFCEPLITKESLAKVDMSPSSMELCYDYMNRRIDIKTYYDYCNKKYNKLKNLLKKYK